MKDFQVGYVNEFSFVTEWMDDTQESFEHLRMKTKETATTFLQFVSGITNETGIKINYYSLDGDDFGSGDVVKWLITFTPTETEGFTEELRGLEKRDYYQVIKLEKKEVLFFGQLKECWEYIEQTFPNLDMESETSVREFAEEFQVEYESSHYHIKL